MDRIAVLIPCYNEAETIARVVSDFRRALPEAVIYVYDNNSTDSTAALAAAAGAVVRREPRQGKGSVVRRMFREVDAKVYIMVDGDDTYAAQDAPEMVRLVLEEQAEMVVGDRLSSSYFTENKRPFHNFGNRLVCRCVRLLFHGGVSDVLTGYRAFSYAFVKTAPVLCNGFSVEAELSIHALDKRLHIKNLTAGYRDRPAGSVSKLKTFRDGTRILRTILMLARHYRPLAFYSVLTLLLVLAGTALCFLPLPAARLPAVCLLFAALLSLFCGLALDSIHHKDCREFELAFIQNKG